MNGFPINGVSFDGKGECNKEGVRLIPHSLKGGFCPSGSDLSMSSDGHLIGLLAGIPVCSGEGLTGSVFTVQSWRPATLTFTIANVRHVPATTNQAAYEGYRIESGGQPACDVNVSNRARAELLLASRKAEAGSEVLDASSPNGDLVIPVGGEVYDFDLKRFEPKLGGRLFNLACVDDALAKRETYNLPKDENSLRMLTAAYCGNPMTVRGAQISWGPPPPTDSDVEGSWVDAKATCIGQPRLMTIMRDGKIYPPQDYPDELQPKGCERAGAAKGKCNSEQWADKLRAECNVGPCSPQPPQQQQQQTASAVLTSYTPHVANVN